MAMKQFVAMSDDQLYRTEGPPGPLVPYQCGVFCWHQLREEAQVLPSPVARGCLDRRQQESDGQRVTLNSSPSLTPSLSATPALSSSTYCAGALEG